VRASIAAARAPSFNPQRAIHPKQQNMKITSKLLLPVAALAISATFATAQDQNNQQRPPGGGERREGERRDRGGDRGGFNMEEFRKRMDERLKGALKVSDEEWAVLQPLVEKVQTKQREAMGSRFSGFGGPGGFGDRSRGRGPGDGGTSGGGSPGGGSGGPPPGGGDSNRGGSPEGQALRTALESDTTSADDIKAKLTAVREVRKKSAAELEAARADLQKVVTVRQEAVLVSMGLLE
jgi:hypothetical protein